MRATKSTILKKPYSLGLTVEKETECVSVYPVFAFGLKVTAASYSCCVINLNKTTIYNFNKD